MSEYHTEGFVRTVTVDGDDVKFTIEVAAPYLFVSKEKTADDSVRRKTLLVAGDKGEARIYAETVEFSMAKTDFIALLIAKANHMKMRLTIDEKAMVQTPLFVSKIEMF